MSADPATFAEDVIDQEPAGVGAYHAAAVADRSVAVVRSFDPIEPLVEAPAVQGRVGAGMPVEWPLRPRL
jgi:hypothetical protein